MVVVFDITRYLSCARMVVSTSSPVGVVSSTANGFKAFTRSASARSAASSSPDD